MDRSDHNHAEDGEELHDDGASQDEEDGHLWPEDGDDDGQEEPEAKFVPYYPYPSRG